jgi:3-dehydroquinate dehydratase type I
MKLAIVCVVTNLNQAKKAMKSGADILEIRVDLTGKNVSIANWDFFVRLFRKIRKTARLPLICTIRSADEGGKYKGPDSDKLALIKVLSPYCKFIDIEHNSSLLSDPYIRKIRNKLIISRHFFKDTPTPGSLEKVVRASLKFRPAIVKIATNAAKQENLITLAKILKSFNKTPLALITMGKFGKTGRFLMPILGSKLTYGFIETAVAPGQINIKELSKLKLFLKA